MIISTLEELRLYFPAHALDSIDTMSGFIDNSENDVLKEKLGAPLYNQLVSYYKDVEPDELIMKVQQNEITAYYDKLLLLCQRIVAYDAFSRAIGVQVLSLNAAGVNIATADDYSKVDKDTIETYRLTCVREMHAAVNRLLCTLEEWTKEVTTLPVETFPTEEESTDTTDSDTTDSEATDTADSEATDSEATDTADSEVTDSETTDTQAEEEGDSSPSSSDATIAKDADEQEIVTLWKQSRFYYDTADLLIPNAVTLQQYLDFYENREKFIQMLPDLRFIHEDMIGEAIGEDFLAYLTLYANNGTTNNTILRSVHRLRKAMARYLVERTQVIKNTNDAKALAHDEAVHILQSAIEYMTAHQNEFDKEQIKAATFYVAPKEEDTEQTIDNNTSANKLPPEGKREGFANNHAGNTFFATPHLY